MGLGKIFKKFTKLFMIVSCMMTAMVSITSCDALVESKANKIAEEYRNVRNKDIEDGNVDLRFAWVNVPSGKYSSMTLGKVSWAAMKTKNAGDIDFYDYELNKNTLQIGGGVTYFFTCYVTVTFEDGEAHHVNDYFLYDEKTDRLIYFFQEPWVGKTYTTQNGFIETRPVGQYFKNYITNIRMTIAMENVDNKNFWEGTC